MSDSTDTVALATELTIAWLANPNTRVEVDAVPAFLATMHKTVSKLGPATADQEEAAPEFERAVSVRKSLADPNFIISMIDGKQYKSLKRHLSRHGLTPEDYRVRYGLKADYPMTAPTYSAARSATAKAIGLGRRVVEKAADAITDEKPAPKSRKGNSLANAKAAAKAHLGSDTD
ncbi:transcriptional regulator [Sphingomonas sp. NBWT7]|uniref:MucR family transcriptional regulator n=1 Tax=Sphingomonas sp. NBWT7 TaxID=2596913 RepID=UPI001626F983|nr:MucR family transcriptional regulator [Sphingomonas sp. NBWT7]QNE32986.1 transcriptional regulator [Sphingomonas sp. NBWT7]